MRAFLAIPIPTELAKKIHSDFLFLSDVGKVIPPKNMHITLNFLGEVGEIKINEIMERMKRLFLARFEIELGGVGFFPSPSFIRIVYLGVKIPKKEEKILKEFSNSLGGAPFTTLHLTVARIKKRPNLELFSKKSFDYGGFVVERLVLYESILKKPNPNYREIFVKRLV